MFFSVVYNYTFQGRKLTRGCTVILNYIDMHVRCREACVLLSVGGS